MDDYMPSRYQLLGRIGEGVHGVVVKARDLQSDGKIVAIKKLSLRTKFGAVSLNTVREIRALQHCRCDNVLELLDMYPDLAGISLVFEYMPHTLYSKLKDEENPLSRATVRRYTAMLLRGLAYLHGVHLMHRDIKPANLLIDRHDALKIADFGLARIYTDPQHRPADRSYSPQVATRWYRAPEILWGCQRYGPSIDLWASGAVFAEMLRGVPLFAGATDIEQLALVVRTLGTPNLKDWPEVRSLPDYNKIRFPNSRGERWEDIFPSCTTRDEIGLVDGLVRYNPAKRLTAEEQKEKSSPGKLMERKLVEMESYDRGPITVTKQPTEQLYQSSCCPLRALLLPAKRNGFFWELVEMLPEKLAPTSKPRRSPWDFIAR